MPSLTTRGDQENYHLDNLPWSVDVGLRKAFLNDRLSLQLQGRDSSTPPAATPPSMAATV